MYAVRGKSSHKKGGEAGYERGRKRKMVSERNGPTLTVNEEG